MLIWLQTHQCVLIWRVTEEDDTLFILLLPEKYILSNNYFLNISS